MRLILKSKESLRGGLMFYLANTGCEDWDLALSVRRRAAANEPNAKEAVRAIRRELKYGSRYAQLSAARLWALMLHASPRLVISLSSRKFLVTLETVLRRSFTCPVVKERVMSVLGGAAFASGSF
ncbi:hypothetical protein V5O48_011765, partial [Marasmius crinis-equi]